MKTEEAQAILRAYPGTKLTVPLSKAIVTAAFRARGYKEDRWGNFHPRDGVRFKIAKRVIRREGKARAGWSNLESGSIIAFAQKLVEDAAGALNDVATMDKIQGARAKRKGAKVAAVKRTKRVSQRQFVLDMVAKFVSSRDPEAFVQIFENDNPGRALQAQFGHLIKQVEGLIEMGRAPVDGDFFRTQHPPAAPSFVDVKAEWIEEAGGVPYTVTLAWAGNDTMIIEIGAATHRIDPISKKPIADFDPREGDSYISGYLRRTPEGPVAALFMIISRSKQQGAGGRVLDLWCNLMESYGVDEWGAQAVGDEGLAFFTKKVEAGRLRYVGSGRGKTRFYVCTGGPEGRQMSFDLVQNPADILSFPEQPHRVTVGSRTYALSDVGSTMILDQFDAPDDDEGAEVLDAGGNPWRYIWLYEQDRDALLMFRYSDGDLKMDVAGRSMPGTLQRLRDRGHLNVVTEDDLEEFEAEMVRRNDQVIEQLQKAWEEGMSDEQRKVNAVVESFFLERVLPEARRGWADIDRGVYPFDFSPNERLLEFVSRLDQGRVHVMHSAMQRAGFTADSGSPLERYVMAELGFRSWGDAEDPQSIDFAVDDVRQQAYDMAKVDRGSRSSARR